MNNLLNKLTFHEWWNEFVDIIADWNNIKDSRK